MNAVGLLKKFWKKAPIPVGLICFGLVVWFAGPMLAIGDERPLDPVWLRVTIIATVVFLVLRAFEFTALGVRWDTNAYGSAVWMLLGLHTTHVLTDWFDTVVLNILVFTGPLEARRFADVSDNAFYWYFVVGAWLPIYAVIYFGARLLPRPDTDLGPHLAYTLIVTHFGLNDAAVIIDNGWPLCAHNVGWPGVGVRFVRVASAPLDGQGDIFWLVRDPIGIGIKPGFLGKLGKLARHRISGPEAIGQTVALL